ncbi:MAG: hypothetical protein JRF33_08575 [Deltaproteobacteria bacterium]|nr:hypothetical protein [Deltaproteobacteria bacterium]
MRKSLLFVILTVTGVLVAGNALAQEAKINHGFLFFASEHYTVDEETFSIYEDGHLYETLIKDNVEALDAFHSYETWHVTSIVTTAFSLAAIVAGGILYMPGVEKEVPTNSGIYGFAAGGGLLLVSVAFELIAWSSISSSAEIYNKELIDEGPAMKFDAMPSTTLALSEDSAHFALTWKF